MNQITQVFYILSNALLIPVMLLLLFSLVKVLTQCGRTLQEYLSRNQQRDLRKAVEHAIQQNQSEWPELTGAGDFLNGLQEIQSAQNDLPRIAYAITQREMTWQKKVDQLRGMVKLGPSLGLMGTLIPLGPALVGLAVGDIQMMSNNLVIAFSTTVLGLFVGMMAGYLVTIQKHWYQADLSLLNFAAERICSSSFQTEDPQPHHENNGAETHKTKDHAHA
ncbi:MotA/TolQ/ExbB proton channel family protein [Gimesia sp.]|uniref:MotA/TolQ/ExbB proton channel family protein n=1 Tax=Gimesia sp. TaxID=2024833 RepID=UPI003A8D520B